MNSLTHIQTTAAALPPLVLHLRPRTLQEEVQAALQQRTLPEGVQSTISEWLIAIESVPAALEPYALAELMLYIIRPAITDDADLDLLELDIEIGELLQKRIGEKDLETFLNEKASVDLAAERAKKQLQAIQEAGSAITAHAVTRVNEENSALATMYHSLRSQMEELHHMRHQAAALLTREVAEVREHAVAASQELVHTAQTVHATGVALAALEAHVDQLADETNRVLGL